MVVSGPMLEQVARAMSHGTVEQQQEAANFLSAWKDSSDALLSASRFLSTDFSPSAQLLSSMVLLSSVNDTWFRYNREELNNVRQSVLHFVFTASFTGSPLLLDRLEAILAAIALNDWPDEWSEFLPLLCQTMASDPSKRVRVLNILNKFLADVAIGQKITLRRRMAIIHAFMPNIEMIMQQIDISNFLGDRDLVTAYLGFTESLALIANTDSAFCERFSGFLFETFMPIDEYAERALKTVETLIMSNCILSHLLPYFSGYLRACQQANRKPIDEFQSFLCRAIDRIVCFLGEIWNNPGVPENLLVMIEGTLTAHRRDKFVLEFWVVWNKILVPAFEELFRPIFPLILSTFYELLPAAMSLSRFLSPLVGEAFHKLVAVDSDAVLQFLLKQPISHSLCCAIGIVKHEALFPMLSQIMKSCDTESSLDLVSSVVFALSRNIVKIQDNPEVVKYFEQLVSTFLFRSPEFQTTVLLGLNHVVSVAPDVFFADLSFIDFLFTALDPGKVELENFRRLCRILAKLIVRAPRDVKDTLGSKLTSMATSYLESGNPADVSLGAEIAWSFGSISACGSYLVTSCLWIPLINAMDRTRDMEVFDDVIAVFPSTIRSAPWGLCRKLWKQFMALISTVQGHDSVIVEAFNQIVQCHSQVKDARSVIVESFVQRLLSEPDANFFDFFEVTDVTPDEEDTVMNVACAALSSVDIRVGTAAARMLRTVIRTKKSPEFLEKWQSVIVQAVFTSLLESRQVPLVRAAANVLFSIYKWHIRMSTFSPDIDQYVISAISGIVDDPEFCRCFAQTLRDAVSDREKFIDCVHDFLITTGRVNPSEIRLFLSGMEASDLSRKLIETALEPNPIAIHNEDEFVSQV